MPIVTKRFRHSRQATDADREAAKKALERAEMSVEEAEKQLNKYSDKWSVRDCRTLMSQAGMHEEEIDAACPTYANDRVRVTLTFTAFTEDGETATVNDGNGNTAEIPVCSILQNTQDSIDVGDTVPCDILREVWETSGLVADDTELAAITEPDDGGPPPDDTPDDAEGGTPVEAAHEAVPDHKEQAGQEDSPEPEGDENQTPPAQGIHNVHQRGREVIKVTLPLTDTERLELAQEMADALAERDSLETEFNAIKKDYKTRIDLQVNLAAQAGETYRAGERTQDVSCDVFEDRTTAQIVYIDSVSGVEVKRRSMTFEERQLRLPGIDVPQKESKQERKKKTATDATPPELSPDNARTCINCGHRDTTTDAMPEPCQTCSQIESGDSDNWTPVHECGTCTHKTTRVNMPPCAGCNLNADESHRGKADAWECAQLATPVLNAAAVVETDEIMPDLPCVDDSPDDWYSPDELDNIPADCIPESTMPDDDTMPSLPEIGDGRAVRQ